MDYRARCKVGLACLGVLERGQTYIRPPLLQISETESREIAQALAEFGSCERSVVASARPFPSPPYPFFHNPFSRHRSGPVS